MQSAGPEGATAGLPRVMRAVVLTGHGGPERLELREDVQVPRPAADEVLIAVAACGVNNTDINTRTGWYAKSVSGATGSSEAAPGVDGSWSGGIEFPLIQGADPAGRIVAVGDQVDEGRIGERVLVDPWIRDPGGEPSAARYVGSDVDGGFAEFLAVPSLNAHPVLSDLSDVELASFPCSYAAAENMLQRSGVSSDQWVLVTGASGGVGGALVQLAKRRQARVLALTSADKVDQVGGLGADVVLDRRRDDLGDAVFDATGGVDVMTDVVGGDLFQTLFGTIRPGGAYATAGAVAGPIVSLDLRTLYLNDITMHGCTQFPAGVFADLVDYIERAEIRPIVAGTFPLEEIGAAQRMFLDKSHIGSIVLETAPPTA